MSKQRHIIVRNQSLDRRNKLIRAQSLKRGYIKSTDLEDSNLSSMNNDELLVLCREGIDLAVQGELCFFCGAEDQNEMICSKCGKNRSDEPKELPVFDPEFD